MNNTDYIKEKLNTLRVNLTVRTLILIAVSSGTASLALKGANFNFDSVINVMFTLGILLSIFILILLTIYDYQIKNLTKKLEW